jgi:hypothetical protein
VAQQRGLTSSRRSDEQSPGVALSLAGKGNDAVAGFQGVGDACLNAVVKRIDNALVKRLKRLLMLCGRPPDFVLEQLVHLGNKALSRGLVIGAQATAHLQAWLAL